MKSHMEGTRYGDSYIGYNVWRLIKKVQFMETHIEGTKYGDPNRGYIVWRLI